MFNYNKPGKGVSENEPEKNIFSLYFSILWRKLKKIIGINFLYIFCSIPFILLAWFIAIPVVADMPLSWTFINYLMLYLLFIGIPPISIGIAAVFKKYSRQQHSWVISEFFTAIKDNLKTTMLLWMIDIFFTLVFMADIFFMGAFQGIQHGIVLITTSVLIFLFISAHFYVYQIILMFDVGAVGALKNAFIIAVAKLPQCLLLFIIVFVAGWLLNNPLTFLIVGYAPLALAINMFSERFLTKTYIDVDEEEE